jgi:hypothetical protein
MAIEASAHQSNDVPATVVDEQLTCSLTGKPITREEAYWAPPLVTARELVTAISSTLIHNPAALGQILFGEQPNVPYAQDARELLAQRRSSEQLKLLVGLLVIAALILVPIFMIALR